MAKRRIYLLLILFLCMIPIGAVSFCLLEPGEGTFWDKLGRWVWATLLNTIPFGGYGDVVPVTTPGRVVAIIIRIYCLILLGVAIYTALQASLFEQVDTIAQKFSALVEKPLNIFISYRRADSAGHSGRIFDRLSAQFGLEHVFMDIDTIVPGEDFIKVIENTISSCDCVVAVIGQDWTGKGAKKARIFNQNDFVRLEIKHALQQEIPVIPVLVNQAHLPSAAELPEDIKGILSQPVLELSDDNWLADFQKFLDMLNSLRGTPEAQQTINS